MAMNWDIKGNVDWDFPLSFAPFFFLRKCSMKCAYLLIRSLVEILEMVFTPGTSFLPGPKRTLEVLFLKFATFQIGIRPYGGEQKCRNFSIIFKCNILHFAKMGIFEKAGWKFCAWSIYLKDFVKSIAWAWSLIEWVPSGIYESGATSTPWSTGNQKRICANQQKRAHINMVPHLGSRAATWCAGVEVS